MEKDLEEKIEKEIRQKQVFSVAGAISQAGKGLMKGASPVSEADQVDMALREWLNRHASDPSGILKEILLRKVRAAAYSIPIDLHKPHRLLRSVIEKILANEFRMQEFVRQIDVRWAEVYQERPHFERAGQAPDPEDEYTHASVRQTLTLLVEQLQEV